MALRCVFLAALALALALLATPASAALVADYRFDDSLVSSVPGAPALNPIGTGHAFATETVDGGPNRVLTFPEGSGLHLPTAGFTSAKPEMTAYYAVIVEFRFAEVTGYRRVLNFRDPLGAQATDDGLYVRNGRVNWFDGQAGGSGSHPGPDTPFTPNGYVELGLVHDIGPFPSPDGLRAWANGVIQLNLIDLNIGRLGADGIRFFQDDTSEHTAAAVSRIRLYDDSQVNPATIAATPDPPPSDGDGDGVFDYADNCAAAANAGQADTDSDGQGDACDADDDGDGVLDFADGCPTTPDLGQRDADGDKLGDACDPDDDGDGVPDAVDRCPSVARAGANGCPGAQLRSIARVRTRRAGKLGIRLVTGISAACPPSAATCPVRGLVTAAKARAGGARLRRLGRVSLTLQPGRTKAISIKLSRRGAAALRRAGQLRVKVAVSATGADGEAVTAVRRARISPPR